MNFPADDAPDLTAYPEIFGEQLQLGGSRLSSEDLDGIERLGQQIRDLSPVEPDATWLEESKARLLKRFDSFREAPG